MSHGNLHVSLEDVQELRDIILNHREPMSTLTEGLMWKFYCEPAERPDHEHKRIEDLAFGIARASR